MIRLVQLQAHSGERRTGLVDGGSIRLLGACDSIYAIALRAIHSEVPIQTLASDIVSNITAPYDAVYTGQSEWILLPPFDHPEEPARCLVSGTGLTHKASALNRQAMHAKAEELNDSIRMYQLGVEGGRPAPGSIGVEPEWFYKGHGTILRAHGEPLLIPPYAVDGGEEPEIAGAYVIDDIGSPRRIGLMMGNEFSDHRLEKRNYLYLAHSKLRTCSIGPELIVDAGFGDVRGRVAIERGGRILWSKPVASGEANMCHSLANLEHHHFKYSEHCRPGDAHIHFLGADAFSFGDGIVLEDKDEMVVAFEGFGRPLRNPVQVEPRPALFVPVIPL